MTYANDTDLRNLVRRIIGDGTQQAMARKFGVSNAYLSDFLATKRTAGPKILDALGYAHEPYYKPVAQSGGKANYARASNPPPKRKPHGTTEKGRRRTSEKARPSTEEQGIAGTRADSSTAAFDRIRKR